MAEVPATEAEQNFIDESPPGFFPENQDSNFGLRRKVFSDQAQTGADQQAEMYSERFVNTSNTYLDEWEKMMGVPVIPASPAVRRERVLGRIRQGPFTNESRTDLIERYIQATFGAVPSFTPSGIPIGAGVPLHAAPGVISQLYRVYEDPSTFSYQVWIDSTVGIDIAGLTRELTFLTPSGISFTIDQTHTTTGLIDWGKTVATLGPSGWWKLGADYNDYSGLAQNGVVGGAPTAIASPGLLPGVAGADAARDLNGTSDYVSIADSAALNSPVWSIHAIVRPDALPTAGSFQFAWVGGSIGNSQYLGIYNTGSVIKFATRISGSGVVPFVDLLGTTTPVIGTTYRLVATWNGNILKLYVNGVLESFTTFSNPLQQSSSKFIGRWISSTWFWNGGLDEIVIFGYPLSDAEVLYLHKQATNTL